MIARATPTSRDKLTRLGEKLDAAEKSGGDQWVVFNDEYAALAMAKAMATRPPKIKKIKTTVDYYAIMAQWKATVHRTKALDEQLKDNSDERSLRTFADLMAARAVAARAWMAYGEALSEYLDTKSRRKQAWEKASRQRKARVGRIANAIKQEIAS
jgi:hypothetical protein